MKKSLIVSCFVLLTLLFLFCSCKKADNAPSVKIDTEKRYLVSIKIDDFEGKGEIFYDKNKNLHLLHTDPTSPLFSMEEIFGEKSVKTRFKDLEYEQDLFISGTAILKNIFDLLGSENGKKVSGKGEIKTEFADENYRFTLYSEKETTEEQKIIGSGWNSNFAIIFIPAA